jgi:hypothetical protein
MILGLLDPDPSIIKQKIKINIDSYHFVTSLRLFTLEKNYVNVSPKNNKQKKLVFFVGV